MRKELLEYFRKFYVLFAVKSTFTIKRDFTDIYANLIRNLDRLVLAKFSADGIHCHK